MKVYFLRYVSSGELMPRLPESKGYVRWEGEPIAGRPPRIFYSIRDALAARTHWSKGYTPSEDSWYEIPVLPRNPKLLEVVEGTVIFGRKQGGA